MGSAASRVLRGVLVCGLAAGLGACMPKPGAAPGPLAAERLETARQRWPDTPPEAWAQARQLYLSKCADCHSYPDLAYYEAGEWPKIMERMGRKAKVTPAEAELLLRFVLASR